MERIATAALTPAEEIVAFFKQQQQHQQPKLGSDEQHKKEEKIVELHGKHQAEHCNMQRRDRGYQSPTKRVRDRLRGEHSKHSTDTNAVGHFEAADNGPPRFGAVGDAAPRLKLPNVSRPLFGFWDIHQNGTVDTTNQQISRHVVSPILKSGW